MATQVSNMMIEHSRRSGSSVFYAGRFIVFNLLLNHLFPSFPTGASTPSRPHSLTPSLSPRRGYFTSYRFPLHQQNQTSTFRPNLTYLICSKLRISTEVNKNKWNHSLPNFICLLCSRNITAACWVPDEAKKLLIIEGKNFQSWNKFTNYGNFF